MSLLVRDHYGDPDILTKIFAAIPWNRNGDEQLKVQQLYPFDQLHGRELIATMDHAARLNPDSEAHLVDIGSGIGGPARFFASTYGCKVTGIDVTPTFVAAAEELSELCGLQDKLTFVEADVAEMPMGDAVFDHAYCFYVGMNLADKLPVLKETFRILKPSGRLLWTEVTTGNGEPIYPLPWSETAAGSHVQTCGSLVELFKAAGFQVCSVDDETDAHLELASQSKALRRTPTSEQRQANEVVLGTDFVARRMNYISSLSNGLLASTILEVQKPI